MLTQPILILKSILSAILRYAEFQFNFRSFSTRVGLNLFEKSRYLLAKVQMFLKRHLDHKSHEKSRGCESKEADMRIQLSGILILCVLTYGISADTLHARGINSMLDKIVPQVM